MDNFNLILLGLIIIVFVVLVALFILPSKSGEKKDKKKEKQEPAIPQNDPRSKDWQEVAHRLEKHVHNLRNEVARYKHHEEVYQKQLDQLKGLNEKLKEKLKHHEEWLAKEQAAREKVNKEYQDAKTGLLKAESDREQEYHNRVRMERDFDELKREVDGLKENKRDLSLKVTELEVQLKGYKEEYTKQKKLNEELIKKGEEMSWVSQAEYEKLEKLLAQKEKEIERIQRDYMGRES